MELKQLQSYVAVVKYKSFTKAASKLFISQPTISTHIQSLEEELNTRLLIRTTRTIETTPRGEELYRLAEHVLKLQDDLLRSWTEEEQKLINLGASTIPSAYILPEVLKRFQQDNPDTRFIINQGDSRDVINGILKGLYDVGVIGMNAENQELSCEPFASDRLVLITPNTPEYRRIHQGEDYVRRLLIDQSFILRENGSGSQEGANRFLESVGIDRDKLKVTARVNDQETIKNLVAAGLGISIISERAAANFISDGRVHAFELNGEAAKRLLYIVTRKDPLQKKNVQLFVTYLKNRYASSGDHWLEY